MTICRMGSSPPFTMKAVYCILIVFIAFDTFCQIDGQLFFIDKEPAIPAILEDETCDCSKVLPLDMSKPDAKSAQLRKEINKKFENVYEPKTNADAGVSQNSDENISQPVDSQSRQKRESKMVITKTKTPSFIWGNMLTIQSVGPIKKLIRSDGDTGFEIKEFQMKEINAEKMQAPFQAVLNRRHKRAAATSKLPKRIRISVKDAKLPKRAKGKVVKKRSIFDDQPSECPTIQNLRKRKDLNRDMILQYLPEIGSDCPACGTKFINQHGFGCQCGNCMQCGCSPPIMAVVQHRPHYIEYNHDGAPITYIPGRVDAHNHRVKSPRYVFDQFGHKYLENNGNLRIVVPDHIVGATSPDHDHEEDIYFNKIREVLYGYKDFQDWNSQNEKGELAPSPIDQQRSVLKFLQDIVKNRYNEPSDHIPVTVENAFNDAPNVALQTNRLFVDVDDEGKVEGNEINIK